ncbi:MAG TPA: PhzF family phenazine biosynthesis protein [Anaeromyxobacteraceae bacterium]|nr:PhzF family phenazine biosynthesis protein [Anaeromyxobacteraceae bacterium]
MELHYRILNVFTVAGDRLSGNPLCVFEDGRSLEAERMQALARQFNLSETTFVLPPERADSTARVRIFTPNFEMPFAGHPTLGTAHVVRALTGARDLVVLEMKAGLVQVRAEGDRWTLRAAKVPVTREPMASADALAAMVGLAPGCVSRPLWVDTGAEQLLLRVRSSADVRAARPEPAPFLRDARGSAGGEAMAYVFAEVSPDDVEARFFFMAGGSVAEDPATGSACANLGGWLLATGTPVPARRRVTQGAQVGRPSLLTLEVDGERRIYVTGEVVELGRGSIRF